MWVLVVGSFGPKMFIKRNSVMITAHRQSGPAPEPDTALVLVDVRVVLVPVLVLVVRMVLVMVLFRYGLWLWEDVDRKCSQNAILL